MSKTVGHITTQISKDTSSIEITQLLGDYNTQEFMQILKYTKAHLFELWRNV